MRCVIGYSFHKKLHELHGPFKIILYIMNEESFDYALMIWQFMPMTTQCQCQLCVIQDKI